MLSLVIPVYKNEENLPRLFAELDAFAAKLPDDLEVVFVVDGSPDRSLQILRQRLAAWPHRSQLIELSRNFGSFAAIAAGLRHGAGDYFAVLAADLQEPPELALEFHRRLAAGDVDVVFGHRTRRTDGWWSQLASQSFWSLYRRFVVKDMPKGGIDMFGCTRQVRDRLLELTEVNTNLIALLFWLGFRRELRPLRTPGSCRGPQRMDTRPENRLRARQHLQLHRPADPRATHPGRVRHHRRGHRRGDGFRASGSSVASRYSAIRR